MTQNKTGRDATEAFLDSLPEIEPGESFGFACHPNVACFNMCCADLNLTMTPYDVLRLRQGIGLTSEPFIKDHCTVSTYPDTGFPAVHLRMVEGPTQPCPHVTPAGCSVYENRPSACRFYPLGRATRLNEEGEIEEQFFLVREPHCRGFEEDKVFTPESWLEDQELQHYILHADRLTALMARQKMQGMPMPAKMSTLALLALYQTDRFADFIRDMKVFDRVVLDPAAQQAILDDDEERLWFGYDFLELMLYGSAEGLQIKR